MRLLMSWLLAASLVPAVCAATAPPSEPVLAAPVVLDNATCQTCHDGKKGKLEVDGAHGEKRALLSVRHAAFGKSVHAKMDCIACHSAIKDNKAPHEKSGPAAKVDCVECHTELWENVQKEDKATEKPRLGLIVENIEAHKKSFHGRTNEDDPSRINATCDQCHDTHSFNIPVKESPEYAEWRLNTPKVCGNSCHEEQLEEYAASAHGAAVLDKGDAKAAVCVDCHTSHAIEAATGASAATAASLVVQAAGPAYQLRRSTLVPV
jgi:hypothetical protein